MSNNEYWVAFLSMASGFATAVGVIVAAWQLILTKRIASTSFEDALVKEYREIAATLPIKALLGEALSDMEHVDKLDEFYRYFDLCNHQIFLRSTGRISKKTWVFWEDGMASNFARPAFYRAWSEIASRANGDFIELKRLFPPEAQKVKGKDDEK